jgi:hypothetical protein
MSHDAWSCDIQPSDDNSEFHITGDVLPLLSEQWDLVIAHPPCTYLTNSGVRWLYSDESRWQALKEGAEFFSVFLNLSHVPMVCIENPIMHKHAKALIGDAAYSQIVQPWMFGHTEKKATCLWLKGLPLLTETNNVKEAMSKLSYAEQNKVHYCSPGKDRAKIRSKTYDGLAAAMADQWGRLC